MHRSRKWPPFAIAASLCLLAFTSAVSAEEIRLERVGGLGGRDLTLALVVAPTARDDGNDARGAAQVLARSELPAGRRIVVVDLPVPAGTRILAHARGAWSPGSEDPPHTLELLPGRAVPVRFRVTAPQDREAAVPPVVIARAWRGGGHRGNHENGELRLPCVLDDAEGTWLCAAPDEPLDLRFDVPGFAPAFAWGREQPRNDGDEVRTVELVAGAAVDGWVLGPSEATVTLRPPGRARGLASERLRFATDERTSAPDGHFRFAHVAPGTYELRVESPGYETWYQALRIPDDRESLVLPEIAMARRITGRFQVSPATDGFGESWTLALSEVREGAAGAVRRVTLDLTGWGEIEGLAPARHSVVLQDSAGSVWYTGKHTIDGTGPLTLDIPHVPVEGRIRAGDEPVRTGLLFGTSQGARQIAFRSDEDGRFEGPLPREGRWTVELTDRDSGCEACGGAFGAVEIPPVHVEAGPGGTAFVEIALPDTEIRGRVVRGGESGDVPVPEAQLVVLRTEGPRAAKGRKAQLWTEDDGTFEVRGIEPGIVRIGAFLPDRSAESAWARVELEEGVEMPEIELRIEDKATLDLGVFVGGRPVAGARIYAFPGSGMSTRATTELDGRASLRIPGGSAGPLLVDSAGEGLLLSRFDATPGGTAPIRLELQETPGDLLIQDLPAIPEPAWLAFGPATVPLALVRNFAPHRLGVTGAGVLLAGLQPGDYTVCLWSTSRCFERTIPPAGRAIVTAAEWEEEEPQ